MKFIYLFLLTIFCKLIFTGCENEQVLNTNDLNGKWTFIKVDTIFDYAEIEILKNNKLKIYSIRDGEMGSIDYDIQNDSFKTINQNYRIEFISCSQIELINNKERLLLYKIPFDEEKIEIGNLKPTDIIKIGTFIIGGFLILDNIPAFLSHSLFAFKGEIIGLEYNP